jgi:hypothetical protein
VGSVADKLIVRPDGVAVVDSVAVLVVNILLVRGRGRETGPSGILRGRGRETGPSGVLGGGQLPGIVVRIVRRAVDQRFEARHAVRFVERPIVIGKDALTPTLSRRERELTAVRHAGQAAGLIEEIVGRRDQLIAGLDRHSA